MASMEPLEFLRSHPPFDQLDAPNTRLLGESLEVTFFPKGTEVLRREGPKGTHLYVIRKGAVRLEREGAIVQELEEGDCFGFPSLIAHASPTSDVVATEDTLCYRIPAETFDRLMQQRTFADFFLTDLAGRLGRAAALAPQSMASQLGAPLDRLVGGRSPILARPDETVGVAAARMTEARVSSIVITDPEGKPLGIVTDQDLRSRVLAAGRGPDTLLKDIMTQPVATLPSSSTLFEALVFMLERNVQHMPLEADGRLTAMVTSGDLVRIQTRSPLHILHTLERRGDAALGSYGRDLSSMVEALVNGGLEAPQIARIVSRLNDALVLHLIHRAEAALGPPPCEYAWVVFGSEGRMEQALLTDQDNALVHACGGPEVDRYFGALADQVIDGLIAAGFPPCPGGYMATRWRRPIREFEELFARWIERPDPRALLEAASFFDFRPVAGTLDLGPLHEQLRRVGKSRLFLPYLANDALRWRPPIGLFRQIRANHGGVDLKKGGIYPIVSLARVYALESGVIERPTLDRLAGAARAGNLSAEGATTLAEAFRFLLRLRLRAQLAARADGLPMGNSVDPHALSPLERRHLKETFLAVHELQERTAVRFGIERLG